MSLHILLQEDPETTKKVKLYPDGENDSSSDDSGGEGVNTDAGDDA